jgi:hypothetical protein
VVELDNILNKCRFAEKEDALQQMTELIKALLKLREDYNFDDQ